MKIHISVVVVLILYLFTNMWVCFLLFFACIVFHECGHLLFALLFGGKVHQIELNIFGGRLDCTLPSLTLMQELCFNLGGIAVNLLLMQVRLPWKEVDSFFYEYNKLLVVFNLLPIYPLDGGRLLEVACKRIYTPHQAFVAVSYCSIFFLIGLTVASVVLKSWGLLLISFFLLFKNIDRMKKKDVVVLQNLVKLFT